MGIRIKAPPPPRGDTFEWLHGNEADIPLDASWFIDGSLFEGKRDFGRRTGFGVVVVSAQNDLLAYGRGLPPDWIRDAAGTEALAFAIIV